MKKYIIILTIFYTVFSYAQTTYEVTPGTKGNEITLTLSNISKQNKAENVQIYVSKSPSSLSFKNDKQNVDFIDISKEKDITFIFDIERETEVNKTDTLEFIISGKNGIKTTKSFILEYIAPEEYKLEQNFPNPFNPVTTIQYQLPVESKITLKIYDILGSEAASLINGKESAGFKEIKFDGGGLASGVYIYRLIAENPESNQPVFYFY